jgi:endonuclease-3 related protein
MENKILTIYDLLLKAFGEQGWWPRFDLKENKFVYDKDFKNSKPSEEEAFIISISAILAQNTNWKNVEKAIIHLNKEKLLSKNALKEINIEKLSELIKPSGYFNQKAKKIKEFLKEPFFQKEDITREKLLKIWGIGEETADSILLYSYNHPIFVIDAYTKRIFKRIGFKEKSYKEFQDLFQSSLLEDYKLFNEYHALLVELAKRNCKKIPICNTCPLNNVCKKLI